MKKCVIKLECYILLHVTVQLVYEYVPFVNLCSGLGELMLRNWSYNWMCCYSSLNCLWNITILSDGLSSGLFSDPIS